MQNPENAKESTIPQQMIAVFVNKNVVRKVCCSAWQDVCGSSCLLNKIKSHALKNPSRPLKGELREKETKETETQK